MNPSTHAQKTEPVTSGLLEDVGLMGPIVARHVRLLAWAKATAAAPDDQTIVIPSEFSRTEFDRAEAMLALELEIMRGMQADNFQLKLIGAGQGRDPIDQSQLTLAIVAYGVLAMLALCVVLYFFVGRVLP